MVMLNEIFKTILVISAIISTIAFIALGWQILNSAQEGKNLNECKVQSLYVCFISVIFAISSFIGGTITESKIAYGLNNASAFESYTFECSASAECSFAYVFHC